MNPQRHGLLVWNLALASLLAGCHTEPGAPPPSADVAALDPLMAQLVGNSRAAVLATPQSAEAWGKLGQVFHSVEYSGEAQQCYRRAAQLDPASPRWLHLLGLLQLQEEPEEAIRHLARAAELAGPIPDAPRVRWMQALVERGRFAEAGALMQSLLAGNPDHAAARVESARVHLARNELARAADQLLPCLTNAFCARAATLLLAQIRLRQGDHEAATQLSRRAATMSRPFDWPDPYLREVQGLRADRQKMQDQINGLLMQQRLPEAEVALARLLKALPGDPEGWLLLGRLRYQQRRCPEADEALRRHLAVQPSSLNGLTQLSLALLCQERWTEAAAVLEQAIALKPDFAQAHNNLGYALARAGDSAGALRSYREALRASPGDVGAHLGLAEELARTGRRDEAMAEWKLAEQLAPGDPRLEPVRARLKF